MHPKVLSPDAWDTVRSISHEGRLEPWIFAGGTGLALQFGHRYSEYLDLFGYEPFDPLGLAGSLARVGRVPFYSKEHPIAV